MKTPRFLKAAGSAVARRRCQPAIAQSSPEIKWR